MSGWRTLHANVENKDKLPSEEEITEYISERGPHSRTSIRSEKLYILAMRRDSSHLKEFAKQYSDAFSVVAIGSGTDTGSGSDHVTFYTVEDGKLEKSLSQDCPIAHKGLRVESTR